MSGLTSIIIPTYNHGAVLAEAIASALAQDAPVEVIVVDDGSTDGTDAFIRDSQWPAADGRLRFVSQAHAGPSEARNRGLAEARGEFVMFLDADDVIDPSKVRTQLAAMTDEIGWVLCDVEICDEARRETVVASQRYGYKDMGLGGWIRPLLANGNFIPIMSPLVRRSVVEGLRFDDRLVPEDWHFWCAVAAAARVRYVPRVLATYRKSRTGRSRRPKQSRRFSPNLTAPLRLNLGCGTPGTRSWHPIDGMENLDKSMGWTFESGLGDFIDHAVHGITVSHSLMYVPLDAWPFVFSEFARVLVEGGVVRITEDDTEHPASSRRGGWRGSQPAVTMTFAARVIEHLERVGLLAQEMTAETTQFADRSLIQAQHGAAPDVFFVEGRKLPGVVFAPHNDDESLFAAFTILRYRPRVVVCFPSAGDYGDSAVREAESREAMAVLGAAAFEQWAGGDLVAKMRDFDVRARPIRVWAPDAQSSHPDHVAVSRAASEVFGDRVTTYHTYVNGQKVRSARPVSMDVGWIETKLRALLRYRTQLQHPRACQFFAMDLHEYLGEKAS